MHRISIVLAIFLMASCSQPKQIVKSNDIKPFCKCEGTGKYNIVMEAGMGNWSLFYEPLFQKLKQDNKICLIDRAGYAMDSVTSVPRDLKTVANELNAILSSEGINNNIILIGHSLGGLYVRQYRDLLPDKVIGMVLLDSASSNQFEKLPKEFNEIMKAQPAQLNEVIKIAQKGYLKYSKGKIPTFGMPENLLDQYYNVSTKPEYYYTMKIEVEAFESNLLDAKKLNTLDDLPLLVIGSKNSMDENILPSKNKDYPYEKHNAIWFELQKKLTELSSNSIFEASDKNHYLNLTDSEQISNSIKLWIKNKIDSEN